MTDYTKTQSFAAKDVAEDTIVGAEFDTEFNTVASAVSTKANKAVPANTHNIATLSASGDLEDSVRKLNTTLGTMIASAMVDADANKMVKGLLLGAGTSAFADPSDVTKKLGVSLSGATTAYTLTLASAHTAARTLTLPDATDTLVGKATTDNLTNKTLTSPTLVSPTMSAPVVNGNVTGTGVKDEDTMSSNSATALATQQSIKAYVDAKVAPTLGLTETSITLGTLIVKMGYKAITVNTVTVTFDTAFPNACYGAVTTYYESASSGGVGDSAALATVPSTTGFTASTNSSRDRLYWVAWGY